jgi:hypothetical protein
MKNKRFEVSYKQGAIEGYRIVVDRKTGVNYLQSYVGNSGGITPLLDREGKPVITPVENYYEE